MNYKSRTAPLQPDDDSAGIVGAKDWTRQLRAAGATVDGFGSGVSGRLTAAR